MIRAGNQLVSSDQVMYSEQGVIQITTILSSEGMKDAFLGHTADDELDTAGQ